MTTTINNEHKKLNVPNLRFPEFQGEWEKFTFDEIAQYKKGPFGSALKKDLFVPQSENAIKVYEQQNAIKKDWTLSRYYITKDYFNTYMKQFVAKAGDLIVSCAGTIGEVYELPKDAEEGVFNQALMRVRVNNEIVNKEIFITVFSSIIDKFSKIYSNGSAIKNIPPFADLKRTQVYLPCKEEQIVIAQLLRSLDERIATQNKIIEDLKMLKSAIIEIEYTPNTKTTSHIGNVIEQISKRNKNNAIQNVLSVSNRQGFIKQSDQFENRNVASEDTSNYKIVEKNDFAFNPARINVGSIARLTTFEKGIVSPMYICFRTEENVAPEYIDFFFESKHFYCEIQKRLEGSVRQCLSFEGLCNIPFSLPSLEMQERIGKRLFTLGQKIKTETDLLELLNKQKQYLLRQMFI